MDTPWELQLTAKAEAEQAAATELKMATIALRDAGLALRKAQELYQQALDNWNRTVAPDPTVKP